MNDKRNPHPWQKGWLESLQELDFALIAAQEIKEYPHGNALRYHMVSIELERRQARNVRFPESAAVLSTANISSSNSDDAAMAGKPEGK